MNALSDALNAANDQGWSAREISRRAGGKISHSVVADYLNGRGSAHPKEYVLAAFAEVFPRLTVQTLRELAGLPAGEKEPYEPPAEAHRLTARQRRAVDELIRLLAERVGGEHGGDTAATSDDPDIVMHRGSGKSATVVEVTSKRSRMQQPTKKAARQDPKKV